MATVSLSHRALLMIGGADAPDFLQRILTADLAALDEATAHPCALLSPQGKVLHEFLVSRDADRFRIDVSRAFLPDLGRRLMLFRLHAEVTFEPLPSAPVRAVWSEAAPFRDARFGDGTGRAYDVASDTGTLDGWTAHRIAAGVAELGTDYGPDDLFPHDVGLAANAGVAVRKGCYVGQEVVSRMHHRGTGRRRVAIVRSDIALPSPGAPMTADGKALGTLGGTLAQAGLAVVRIDRASEAIAAARPIMAGDVPVALEPAPGADWSLDRPALAT